MNVEPRAVDLFAAATSPLGAAVSAALSARGYRVDTFHAADTAGRSCSRAAVLVLDGDQAGPTTAVSRASRGAATRWICLGPESAASELVTAAQLGMPVLNADTPFTVLLARLERLLEAEAEPATSTRTVSRIERAVAEAAALSRLTGRERAVLCQLMRGHSVEQIAAHSTRTVYTIRSQVQSMLRRLGARSQLEAVAIGYRSGAATPLESCLDEIHQYE